MAGLQQVNEALFWPFHVAKRSTCPVELDSFPEHILNASPFAPSDSRYNFTSRTLTVLWEEERLRTGIYPPRAEKKKRIIKAGASLTDEDMLERLKEVCNAKETSPSQEASMQNEHAGEDERGAYVESGAGEEEVDSSAIFTMQSSYEDMLNILDASASFPTEEAIIEPFEDGQNEEAIDEEGKEDFEEDEVEIKRTWDDIADCTQNTSSTDHEDRIKAETVRRLDEECASQVVENEANSSRTDLKGFQLVHIASISKPNLNCKKFLGEDIAASSPGVILEPRDEGLMDIDSKAHSYLNQVNSPVSSGKKTVVSKAEVGLSPGTCLIVRPKARPPSREMINETTSDGKAFIISYTTPFFSERKDEVKRSEIFGGRRIHVRKSGADGYIPFPCYFGNEYGSTIVEVLPRIICPIKKPPTIAALRNALVKTTGNMARLSKNESVMIDSAGRQVQLGNKGDALEQLTGSLEPNYDIVKGIHDDIDLARLLNEDPNSTSSSDVEVGAHRTVPSTPIRDGSDALEYNRPMSPKYDEAYQIRSDRLLDCKSDELIYFLSHLRLTFHLFLFNYSWGSKSGTLERKHKDNTERKNIFKVAKNAKIRFKVTPFWKK